jgi:acyl-CoA reductase-like NAD-dependent aldehyde dehydrogenase
MFQLPENIPLKFITSEGKWTEVHSPNDGTFLCKVQEATEKDIQSLLAETKRIQAKISSLLPFERSAILKKTAQYLKDIEDQLAFVIASEGGKPLKDAQIEVQRAIGTLELCGEETLRLSGEMIPMERSNSGKDHIAFTMKDPIGPVLAISAFNHPLNLIAHQIGCAIAAGCSVVLKPAPTTPMSAHFLEEAFKKAGLPSEGIRIVHAEIPILQLLISSSEFDFVSFIGSAKVGWELRKLIAPGTRLALEHGGQAPAVVREDADIDSAVNSLTRGAFYHAGQVCISTQIVYVHESLFKNFLQKFKESASKLIVGSATEATTDIGPLIRPGEVKRLQSWIQEAIDKGAICEIGNKVSGNLNQYLSPTILSGVSEDSTLMKEEAFGPVVCVNSYHDEDQLLNRMNNSDYLFEASLFTKDITKALQMAKKISTMTFVINNHTAFRVDQMPFGGHKKSGLGMGGVKYSIEEMTRLKQVIIKI